MSEPTETLDFLYGLLEEKKKSSKTKPQERRIVQKVQAHIRGIRKNSVNQQTRTLNLLKKYMKMQETKPDAFFEMVILPPLVRYQQNLVAQPNQSAPPPGRAKRKI